ncbi:hypothetical protein HPB51_000789 [Rhipicephalus microplus]|uniref:Chitin-binding type-2 domain-containing protein n=1 Tax=Rhipicephalus microplus TaxID=6941 RepID=A0A9J6DED5_RHIMP|nr:hypothetical protein HPB51_000789 [Rhipicephalus microplus]
MVEPSDAAQFGNDTATKSAFLFSPRRSAKFPIMRPRLRTTTRSPLPDPPPSTPRQENLQVKRQAVLESVLKQADIFELSSSDFSPAVAWPVPRRPASRRFRPNAISQPSTARPLLKLRQPKPTRPPAYSLDGFVPKPSIIRITTTEAPPHIRKMYASPKTEAPPFRKNAPRFGSKKSKTKPLTNDYDDDGHFRKGRKHHDSSGRKGVQRIMGSRGPRKGIPGVDYPNFHRIPTTGFDCNDKQFPGMYADPDAGCQVWHMCTGVPNLGARHSFLCPNGTIFNERRGVCDWCYAWSRVWETNILLKNVVSLAHKVLEGSDEDGLWLEPVKINRMVLSQQPWIGMTGPEPPATMDDVYVLFGVLLCNLHSEAGTIFNRDWFQNQINDLV